MRALAPQAAAEHAAAPPIVHEVLRSTGRPLESGVQTEMDTRFGHDFSQVRVHADDRAAASTRAVSALAYTVGRDIVFDEGRYAPGSPEGRRLLAHELAHVVQQHGAADGGELRLARTDDPAEAEAETLAQGRAGTSFARARPNLLLRLPGPWEAASALSAGLWDPKLVCASGVGPDGTFTHEESGPGEDLFSRRCLPRICAGAQVPFEYFFHVDATEIPRPQPFENPRLAATVVLTPAGGGADEVLHAVTGVGEYVAPGDPLEPSFGSKPANAPSRPGTLAVSLALSDPSSGMVTVYSDELPVVDCRTTAPSLRWRPGAHEWDPMLIGAGLWDPATDCVSTVLSVPAEEAAPGAEEPDPAFAHREEAGRAGADLFSAHCVPKICAGVELPFEFMFSVDAVEAPRPEGFEKPRLGARATLEPEGGGPDAVLLAATGEGEYEGPGKRLQPSFGVKPRRAPPQAGTLYVSLIIHDPSSGTITVYSDAMPVEDCLTPRSSVSGTGDWIVLADPENAPLDFERVGRQHGLDVPGEFAEVMVDERGREFYLNKGRRIYLPKEEE